jgi:hypothetical protein
VEDISFVSDESKSKELHIHIGFPAEIKFPDETGVPCRVHDKVEREWQHLNFFKHKAGNQAQIMALLRGLGIGLIRKNFQATIEPFADSISDLESMLRQLKFL